MKRKNETELLAELDRLKAHGAEVGYQYSDRVDFSRSDYWFNVEIDSAYGVIHEHYFSCKTLDALKEALTWLVNDTKFSEVVAFVKDRAYVTFRSRGDIETFDDYYRDYFRFAEDVRETYPELADRLFTKEQMKEVYQAIIDKKEYSQFDSWLQDMCRAGLVYSCHKKYVPVKKERKAYMERKEEMKNKTDALETDTGYPPVYRGSYFYAREHGEVDRYQHSNHLNEICCNGIEEAIRDNYDGIRLNEKAVTSVIEEFGAERVAFVLASTVLYKSYDGRFSPENKKWAAGICPEMAAEMQQSNPVQLIRPHTQVTSHPAVLDGFINLFRSEVNRAEQKKEAEYMLLNGSVDSFGIYQINRNGAGREYLFEGTRLLQKMNHKVNGADYDLIYVSNLSKTETLSETETLDMIFERFNLNVPEDFTGHSLSVSDVILINRDGRPKACFVDSIGFTELPDFVQERQNVIGYARNGEMQKYDESRPRNLAQEKEGDRQGNKSDNKTVQREIKHKAR
ncbi:MAG: DUF3849 domain-containing protein [Lachnospiraceae bacterium]|nr:DUF3849 domain-containing protein [Lachnospiraceae bacterium]